MKVKHFKFGCTIKRCIICKLFPVNSLIIGQLKIYIHKCVYVCVCVCVRAYVNPRLDRHIFFWKNFLLLTI